MSRRILLIISGGIAAYKSLELIRRLKERGYLVRVVLTPSALHFVTPLSVSALSNDRVFVDLFDLNEEQEIGHIRLSREADLVVVAPASADLLAKMAGGHANDLATAVLLATDKPVLVAPAMNSKMWSHKATQRNISRLTSDGISFIGPNNGEMAEREEAGVGRMSEPMEIVAGIENFFSKSPSPGAAHAAEWGDKPLRGRHVLVTSGPTREPIDPVRYLTNHSSGKQGYAIAEAARELGARVTLVSGPVNLPKPTDVELIVAETAEDMLKAVHRALPADIAVLAAAVADWKIAKPSIHKLKKTAGEGPPPLALAENNDILKSVTTSGSLRPKLIIGFAAETENVLLNAQRKRSEKGADWMVANDVSLGTGTFGGAQNTVHLVTSETTESWPRAHKKDIAQRLMQRAAQFLNHP